VEAIASLIELLCLLVFRKCYLSGMRETSQFYVTSAASYTCTVVACPIANDDDTAGRW